MTASFVFRSFRLAIEQKKCGFLIHEILERHLHTFLPFSCSEGDPPNIWQLYFQLDVSGIRSSQVEGNKKKLNMEMAEA